MISVDVFHKNGRFYRLTLKGHALYDVYGKDIVCASISSIVLTNLMYIEENNFSNVLIRQKDAYIDIILVEYSVINQHLLMATLKGLSLIQEKFPNNIKINIIEKDININLK